MGTTFARLLNTARFRRVLNIAQKAIAVVVVWFLGVKLYHIGWGELWSALPRAPSFYMAFAAIYAIAPLAELFIYSSQWGVGLGALPTFLRKRIYNEIVIDYSGEAYLYLWARRMLGETDRKLLSTIKDVNLLSGVASNAVTLALVIAFAAGGYTVLLDGIDPALLRGVAIAAALAVAVMLSVVLFGRRILGVTRAQSFRIGAVHLVRMILVLVLQVVQWGSALPDVPLSQWLMFLTAQMLLTRVPFIPNRDVMLMWLGVTLAPAIAAPESHVASMFVAAGALSLLAHAGVFAVTSLVRQPPAAVQTV